MNYRNLQRIKDGGIMQKYKGKNIRFKNEFKEGSIFVMCRVCD